jgi:hypothetical protein
MPIRTRGVVEFELELERGFLPRESDLVDKRLVAVREQLKGLLELEVVAGRFFLL